MSRPTLIAVLDMFSNSSSVRKGKQEAKKEEKGKEYHHFHDVLGSNYTAVPLNQGVV